MFASADSSCFCYLVLNIPNRVSQAVSHLGSLEANTEMKFGVQNVCCGSMAMK